MSASRSKMLGLAAAGIIAMTGLTSGSAFADAQFRAWVKDFRGVAARAGISTQVYDAAFANVTSPDPSVLKSARYQPEFVKPIWSYIDSAASPSRVKNGALMLKKHARTFDAIEARYGVEREIVAAIWGMESSYGAVLDNPGVLKPVIRSLATLAYADKRRAKFGRQQLIGAMKILQRGDVSVAGLTGSWAGAMGHTQFIPTTYNAHAVDLDGDGRRNIWTSAADALASTANYLKKSGWQTGQTWGYEVELPQGFDYRHADEKSWHTIDRWEAAGVRRTHGRSFKDKSLKAVLYVPAGANGPAFLMLKNFFVIKEYNNSNAYAMGVGHLADRMIGGGAFAGQWPRNDRALARAEAEELQSLLAQAGFSPGKIDGKLGANSRAAIRAYQIKAGLTPDGHPGLDLLDHMRAGR